MLHLCHRLDRVTRAADDLPQLLSVELIVTVVDVFVRRAVDLLRDHPDLILREHDDLWLETRTAALRTHDGAWGGAWFL
jgi:hypothetical protein